MANITLVFDYNKRSRALGQLMNMIQNERLRRRDDIYSRHNRTLDRSLGDWWTQHLHADDTDQQRLDCLEQLWNMPGMSPDAARRLLRVKAFVKYAERLVPMLDHRYAEAIRQGDNETADAYWLTTGFVLTTIHRLRYENGMPYDVNYYTPEDGNIAPEPQYDGLSLIDTQEVKRIESDFEPSPAS